MVQSVLNKICPFISTADKIAPCIRECQFCSNGKCLLANFSSLTVQMNNLNNKIDQLNSLLVQIKNTI